MINNIYQKIIMIYLTSKIKKTLKKHFYNIIEVFVDIIGFFKSCNKSDYKKVLAFKNDR